MAADRGGRYWSRSMAGVDVVCPMERTAIAEAVDDGVFDALYPSWSVLNMVFD